MNRFLSLVLLVSCFASHLCFCGGDAEEKRLSVVPQSYGSILEQKPLQTMQAPLPGTRMDNNCPVCLDEKKRSEMHELVCAHMVCKTCYQQLKKNNFETCPLCRARQPQMHIAPEPTRPFSDRCTEYLCGPIPSADELTSTVCQNTCLGTRYALCNSDDNGCNWCACSSNASLCIGFTSLLCASPMVGGPTIPGAVFCCLAGAATLCPSMLCGVQRR
jgi:hypothetical protein